MSLHSHYFFQPTLLGNFSFWFSTRKRRRRRRRRRRRGRCGSRTLIINNGRGRICTSHQEAWNLSWVAKANFKFNENEGWWNPRHTWPFVLFQNISAGHPIRYSSPFFNLFCNWSFGGVSLFRLPLAHMSTRASLHFYIWSLFIFG